MIRSILLALLLAAPAAGQEFRTISDQFDSDNVSITGGSIDGVTLGAATPGSGAFTTLSTTDVMTLGSTVLSGASSNTLSVINGSADCAIRAYSEVGANAEYIALRRSGTAYFLDQAWFGSGSERSLYIRGLQLRLQSGGNTDQIGCFGGNIQFYANPRPSADGTIDNGAAAAAWKDLYFDGVAYLGSGTELVGNGDGGLIVRNAANTARLTVDSSGNLTPAGTLRRTVTAGITASTTQTQGQGALTAWLNEVSTVANANDTVTLPTAVAGMEVVVCNNGANTLQIFPASGDNLGAGVDTATTLAAGSNVTYVSYDATNWEVK